MGDLKPVKDLAQVTFSLVGFEDEEGHMQGTWVVPES